MRSSSPTFARAGSFRTSKGPILTHVSECGCDYETTTRINCLHGCWPSLRSVSCVPTKKKYFPGFSHARQIVTFTTIGVVRFGLFPQKTCMPIFYRHKRSVERLPHSWIFFGRGTSPLHQGALFCPLLSFCERIFLQDAGEERYGHDSPSPLCRGTAPTSSVATCHCLASSILNQTSLSARGSFSPRPLFEVFCS